MYDYCVWKMGYVFGADLANTRRVSIPHTRVPLLKEGRGVVGTMGVSSTMPILVVFLHNIYKNRDTSIVQGTWSRVWIPYRLFLYTQRDRSICTRGQYY